MTREPARRSDLAQLRATASELVYRHRRSGTAALAGVAVILGVAAARPRPPATTAVWVAAHDLPGAAPLRAGDLRREQLPSADVPDHALPGDREPVGSVLAAPVRRGEPLTDLRLLSPDLTAASGVPGDLVVPVRVTDGAAALALVKPGEQVSVIVAGDPGTGVASRARTVVEDVRVLAVPTSLTDDGGGLVVVAATPKQARAIAEIADGDQVSVGVQQ